MATKIRPIVFKINTGLELKLSDAVNIDTTNNVAVWESPTYPDVGADFTGKSCVYEMSDAVTFGEAHVIYVDSATGTAGPLIASSHCGATQAGGWISVPGTYTEQCASNPATEYWGKYIAVKLYGINIGTFNDVMSKLSIRIV